jgi:hypothetical protein
MTIFKKDIRTWFALILSLLVLTIIIYYSAELAYRSDVNEITTDSRYAKILTEIHEQNLDVEKIRDVVPAEEFGLKRFCKDLIGSGIFFVAYGLIFRCVARVVLGGWKSPWIS